MHTVTALGWTKLLPKSYHSRQYVCQTISCVLLLCLMSKVVNNLLPLLLMILVLLMIITIIRIRNLF